MTTNIFDLEQSPHKLDDENINELISGIQKITPTGITRLPSRDISISCEKNVQDIEVIPNYIPKESTSVVASNEQVEFFEDPGPPNNKYDEIQLPLFVSVLYILFQLASTKKYVLYYVPSLFLPDGNFNIYGHIFMSVIFTAIVYSFDKYIKT